jgi:hypothetical protein
MSDPQPKEEKKLSLLQTAASVAAAFFGVQSKTNKERDFQQGSHRAFIIVGLVFTLIFIAVLATIVSVVVG